MTLTEYYESLPRATFPKTELANKISKECGVTYNTVMNWVKGRALPKSPELLDKLCEVTGIGKDEIFGKSI